MVALGAQLAFDATTIVPCVHNVKREHSKIVGILEPVEVMFGFHLYPQYLVILYLKIEVCLLYILYKNKLLFII